MDSRGSDAAAALAARLSHSNDPVDRNSSTTPRFHTAQGSGSHGRSMSGSDSIYFDTAETVQSLPLQPFSDEGEFSRSHVVSDSVEGTYGLRGTLETVNEAKHSLQEVREAGGLSGGLESSSSALSMASESSLQEGHQVPSMQVNDNNIGIAITTPSTERSSVGAHRHIEENRANREETEAEGDITLATSRQPFVADETAGPSHRSRDISSDGLDGSGSTDQMRIAADDVYWSSEDQDRIPRAQVVRELHAARRTAALQRSQQAAVLVPRWQPDVEVTVCPICSTQFSFFIRKHHCRKCGRVVCAACSPHRITIPYQFIVQPPSANATMDPPNSRRRPTLDSARAGSSLEVENLGGGERVRLCNPCVPDPNVAPPQTPLLQQRRAPIGTHTRSSSSVVSPFTSAASGLSTSSPSERPVLFNGSQSTPRRNPRERQTGSMPQSGNGSDPRYRASTVSHSSTRPYQNIANLPSALPNAQSPLVSSNRAPGNIRIPASAERHRSLPRRPQRIAEEDECPICHEELPSSQLSNSETLRAEHIAQCIENHMKGGSATRPSAQTAVTSPPIPLGTRPPQAGSSSSAVPTTPAPVANTPEARTAAREQAHAAVVLGLNSSPSSNSPFRRLSGLFPYKATEKDCVDEAECTICLEEFEVGVDMARLECFCRFHLHCIRGWFERHYGQCPVHHQGF